MSRSRERWVMAVVAAARLFLWLGTKLIARAERLHSYAKTLMHS